MSINRRQLLTRLAGGIAAGAILPDVLGLARALAAKVPAAGARKKHLIVLWMEGGPSQLDTFDPKPGTEQGGPFAAIETAAHGIRISEHLPKIAAEMKSIALIRSMTSREGNHPRARYLLHTGYAPGGTAHHPGIGSVVSHELGSADQPLPAFVSISGAPVGSGFLGAAHAPFIVQDPSKLRPDLRLPDRMDPARNQRRLDLLGALEAGFEKDAPEYSSAHAATRKKALSMIGSPKTEAFDISKEPQRVRDAYGDSSFGRGVLLARRLVEAGVQAVEVTLRGWDTHEENFDKVRALCQALDPAMSSLIRDLRERGLLEDTLLVWMGEFGRTPRINGKRGRDHFPKAYSVALAGAGLPGGSVIGSTAADGMDVKEHPVTVPDLFATIYRRLGVDLGRIFAAPSGRPVPIVGPGGAPVKDLTA